jgi:hypothetical protein
MHPTHSGLEKSRVQGIGPDYSALWEIRYSYRFGRRSRWLWSCQSGRRSVCPSETRSLSSPTFTTGHFSWKGGVHLNSLLHSTIRPHDLRAISIVLEFQEGQTLEKTRTPHFNGHAENCVVIRRCSTRTFPRC